MKNIYLLFIMLCLLAQCYSYQENPLIPEEQLKQTLEHRSAAPSYCTDSVLTFAQCARWMSDSSYALRTVETEYQMYKAVAELKTPYPNPSVSAGPNMIFGGGITNHIAPYASMGFVIPLGPRLSRQDDVNAALMRQAYQKTLITHRQLYLNLRKAYLNCMIAEARINLMKEIYDNKEVAHELFVKAYATGDNTFFELKSHETETKKVKLLMLNAQSQQKQAIKELASLLGTQPKVLQQFKISLQTPKLTLDFTLDSTPALILKNNLQLAELEAEYTVADMNYKLELAKQIPDLSIGPNYSMDEDYVSTITPSVGIELPVSDRNQQSIVSAHKSRDLALMRYKEQLHEALNAAEDMLSQYSNYQQQLESLRKEAKPASEQAVKIAQASTQAGVISTIDYITASIAHRELLLEELELELSQINALINLENSIGIPLAPINDESFDLFKDIREASVEIINDQPPVNKEN